MVNVFTSETDSEVNAVHACNAIYRSIFYYHFHFVREKVKHVRSFHCCWAGNADIPVTILLGEELEKPLWDDYLQF